MLRWFNIFKPKKSGFDEPLAAVDKVTKHHCENFVVELFRTLPKDHKYHWDKLTLTDSNHVTDSLCMIELGMVYLGTLQVRYTLDIIDVELTHVSYFAKRASGKITVSDADRIISISIPFNLILPEESGEWLVNSLNAIDDSFNCNIKFSGQFDVDDDLLASLISSSVVFPCTIDSKANEYTYAGIKYTKDELSHLLKDRGEPLDLEDTFNILFGSCKAESSDDMTYITYTVEVGDYTYSIKHSVDEEGRDRISLMYKDEVLLEAVGEDEVSPAVYEFVEIILNKLNISKMDALYRRIKYNRLHEA